jgi:adenylate kinase family enzyme
LPLYAFVQSIGISSSLDTIILLNIPSEICLINAYNREEEYIKQGKNREDMAEGFDGTITEEFVSFIKNFEKDTMIKIKDILKHYKEKDIKIISNYKESEEFIACLKKEYNRMRMIDEK